MSEVEVLADYNDLCGEGPIWNPQRAELYWTDINGRKSFSWSWSTRTSRILQEGFEISGLAMHADGGFTVVNSNGFWLWDGARPPKLVAAEVDGQRCALNDCIADPEGGLFSGSTFFNPESEDYPSGYLFRADTDGTVHIVDEGLLLSNGIGFSPDESTLYLADSAVRRIYAYDYNRRDGSIRNRRTFVTVPSDEGIPDGLVVDADGFIWSAQWFGSCLVRYDPDGKVERRVSIPATQVTSLAFGGPEMEDIFVTSASVPDALQVAPAGYSATANYSGGKLFHLNLGIRGREEYRTRISIP